MHRKKLFVTNQLLAVSWNGRIGESFVAMKRMKNWRTVGLGSPLTNGMASPRGIIYIIESVGRNDPDWIGCLAGRISVCNSQEGWERDFPWSDSSRQMMMMLIFTPIETITNKRIVLRRRRRFCEFFVKFFGVASMQKRVFWWKGTILGNRCVSPSLSKLGESWLLEMVFFALSSMESSTVLERRRMERHVMLLLFGWWWRALDLVPCR